MCTFILVHGFWIGPWAWEGVQRDIEAAGFAVVAPALPGAEPDASDRGGIGLEDHVQAVLDIVDGVDGRVVLVGHSAGGAVVHAVVDRRPERISRAVYVDTRPLPNGVALNPTLAGAGDEVPLRAWSDFAPGWLDHMDQAILERFQRRAVPSPARAARDLQRLSDPRRYDVPVTIIATTSTEARMRELAAADDEYFTELPLIKHLSFVEIPTGHYPMLTRPMELAEAIRDSRSG